MEDTAREQSSFIVALIENRAKEVGVAVCDLRSASLHLSQFVETSRSYQTTKTFLEHFSPHTIILCSNSIPPDGMIGVGALVQLPPFTSAAKVPVSRGCFDDTKGALAVQEVSRDDKYRLDLSYKQNYLSLSAAHAVLKWVEIEMRVTVQSRSLEVTFNVSRNYMGIDAKSLQNLEVAEPRVPKIGGQVNKRGSLFGILNTAKTLGGMRLLKANLLQPLKDTATLDQRLDCLEELLSNEGLFSRLSSVLQSFPKDIDSILSRYAFKRKKSFDNPLGASALKEQQESIKRILDIADALEKLPALSDVLSDARCDLLGNIKSTVCLHTGFEILRQSIEDKIPRTEGLRSKQAFMAWSQLCFAVKPGVDGFLDMARKTFNDTSMAIQELTTLYVAKYGLESLKVMYKHQKEFHFTVSAKEVEEKGLPGTFIQVTRNGPLLAFKSEELNSLNRRNKEAAGECLTRSERILDGISQQIRQEIRLLFVLSECLSLLDVLVNSFAALVSSSEPGTYVRPEFTEDGPLAIEGGRHPIMENFTQNPFVPNNTFLSEASNMLVVLGPNMSGKSTYLRQVGLLTIMAHIGCYVPAQFASFRIVDHLFTRMGVSDDIESNSSTFMTEMREMAFISQNLNSRSLVLIDELGKATSTADGFALAWACSEELLSTNAYTINSTHEHRLAELPMMYPNAKVSHFSLSIENNTLAFKYALKEGYLDIPDYGILLAKVAGLPEDMITDARRIAADIEKKAIKRLDFGLKKYKSLRRDYQLAQKLLCLEHATLPEEDLKAYLQDLKDRYLDGKPL